MTEWIRKDGRYFLTVPTVDSVFGPTLQLAPADEEDIALLLVNDGRGRRVGADSPFLRLPHQFSVADIDKAVVEATALDTGSGGMVEVAYLSTSRIVPLVAPTDSRFGRKVGAA